MPLKTAPAGFSSVVAGAYRSAWNGYDMGLITGEGFQLRYRNTAIPITADITGETIVDMIHTGTLPTITMTLMNWNAQAIEPLSWWMGFGDGIAGYEWGVTDGVGQKAFDFAKPLVLTACHYQEGESAGPLAANPTIDPLSMTIYKTIPAPDQDIEVLLSHKPRFITLTLQILPVTLISGESPNDPPTVTRASSCDKLRFWTSIRNNGAHLVSLT
jgi:hypothetical protein